MIKRLITTLSMAISSLGFAQPINDVKDIIESPEQSADFSAEIIESCGHLTVGSVDYSQCVEIVSIDFTVFPHNAKGGDTCPGSCVDDK